MVQLTTSLVFLLGALRSVSGSAIADPNYSNKGGVCESAQYSNYAELAYYEPAKQYCRTQYPATVTVTAKGHGYRRPRTALPEPGYERPAGYASAKPAKCHKGRKECLLSSVKNGPKTAAKTVCSCYVPQKTVTKTVYPPKYSTKTTKKCTTSSTTKSTTTRSSTTKSITTESSTTKSITTESSTTKSITTESSTTKSITTESSTTEPSTTGSSTTQSSTTQSSTASPEITTTTQSTTTMTTTEPSTTTTTAAATTTTTTTTSPSTTTAMTTTATTTSSTTTTIDCPNNSCGAAGQFAAATVLRTRDERSAKTCQDWCIAVPGCEGILVLPRDASDAFGPNECSQVAGQVQRVGPGAHRIFGRTCETD
ncbi:hypothetical protein BST61_g1940 [Cercospora zeina]